MKILLMNLEHQYLEVLHLTPQEEDILLDWSISDKSEQIEAIEKILDGRDIEHDDFNPIWMVVDDDIPVFDEYDKECPACVIR